MGGNVDEAFAGGIGGEMNYKELEKAEASDEIEIEFKQLMTGEYRTEHINQQIQQRKHSW